MKSQVVISIKKPGRLAVLAYCFEGYCMANAERVLVAQYRGVNSFLLSKRSEENGDVSLFFARSLGSEPTHADSITIALTLSEGVHGIDVVQRTEITAERHPTPQEIRDRLLAQFVDVYDLSLISENETEDSLDLVLGAPEEDKIASGNSSKKEESTN